MNRNEEISKNHTIPSDFRSQFETPKKNNDVKEITESSKTRTPSGEENKKEIIKNIKVITDVKFENMKENNNTMYIFTNFSRDDIEFRGGIKYPAVNRKIHQWSSKPRTNQRGNLARKFPCQGLENKSCKAIRWHYYCEGKCKKKVLSNSICCDHGKEKKLVVFFEGNHECKAPLHQVSSIDDVVSRIKKSVENRFIIHTGFDELPEDVNENSIYILQLKSEKETPISEQIKCGRSYGKFQSGGPSTEERRFFGPYVGFTKSTAVCRGFYKCSNSKCQYFERFNVVNQVIRGPFFLKVNYKRFYLCFFIVGADLQQ